MKWIVLSVLCAAVAVQAKPHGRHGYFPCGLPSFTEELPADAQEKVKEIWKDYKEGDKCRDQQKATRKVIDTLPKDKRKELFKSLHVLPFLKGASADVQDQFKAIFKDRKIPREDRAEKMKDLAEKLLKGDQKKAFDEFYERMQARRAEFKEKKEKLSKEAKEALEKIEKQQEESSKIYDGLSESVRDELFDLFHGHFGNRHRKED